MSALKLPTSPLVARAWLALVPGITVAMTGPSVPRIPKDALPAWVATGFLSVQTVGGSPDPEMPVGNPVISVKCWAANVKQDPATKATSIEAKIPWSASEELAETVIQASYAMARDGSTKLVTLPVGGYRQAIVHEAYPLTHPRQIPDSMNRACHQFDLQLVWSAVLS